MNDLVIGRAANAPGAIIQDDLGATFGLTEPIGMLLAWQSGSDQGGVYDAHVILEMHGRLCSPWHIGVGPGAWFVTNVP